MATQIDDALTQLSAALAARTAAATPFVAALRCPRARPLTATLWRDDVALASDQVFPKTAEAELALTDGRRVAARVAGRDPATNIVALRLDAGSGVTLPAAAEPALGALALVLAADRDGAPIVHIAGVRALGPAWHSGAGGLIDRRIELDMHLASREEGGPVFDASGGILGMSTAGPRGRALVIPAATIERVLPALLAAGRVERGWLGLGLHAVALPDNIAAETGQRRGLIVLRLEPDAPAAKAGVLAGDILVAVGDLPAVDLRAIAGRLGPDAVGQPVALQLVRAGAVLSLEALVTARPAR